MYTESMYTESMYTESMYTESMYTESMYTEQPGQFLNPVAVWSCTSDSLFTPAGEIIVLRIGGEIDLATLPVLEAALDANLDQQPDHLLVDLTRVTYCCARGMDLLVTIAGYAAGQGVGYAVSGVPAWLDHIWRIFFHDEPPVRYRSAAMVVSAIQARQAGVLIDHPAQRGPLRSMPTPNPPAQGEGRMIRVLPDVSMQVLGGVETTRRLRIAWPGTSSVRHTATLDGSAVLDTHPAGTAGSQLTSVDMDGLIEAVCTAHEGGEAWDKRAAAILRRRTESAIRPSRESLSPESPATSDVLVLRRRR